MINKFILLTLGVALSSVLAASLCEAAPSILDPAMVFVRNLGLDPEEEPSVKPYGGMEAGKPQPPSLESLLERKAAIVALMKQDKDAEALQATDKLLEDVKWAKANTDDMVADTLMISTRYTRFLLLQLFNRSIEALIELIEIAQFVETHTTGNVSKVFELYNRQMDKLAESSVRRILQLTSKATEQEVKEAASHLEEMLSPEKAAHLDELYQKQFAQLRAMVHHAAYERS